MARKLTDEEYESAVQARTIGMARPPTRPITRIPLTIVTTGEPDIFEATYEEAEDPSGNYTFLVNGREYTLSLSDGTIDYDRVVNLANGRTGNTVVYARGGPKGPLPGRRSHGTEAADSASAASDPAGEGSGRPFRDEGSD